MKIPMIGLGAIVLVATASQAAMAPTARQFVMKAGASDKFEISEAQLMLGSTNPDIQSFAQQMITDHTKSTDMVKTAAMADGLTPAPPMLTAKQKADLAKLTAAKGMNRDKLYIRQQKPAHAEALALMRGYSSSGKATHLKDTAGQIEPVVQAHIDMLDKMAM